MIQCRFCGRVLVSGEWVRDDQAVPTGEGMCPPCGRIQEYQLEAARKRGERRVRRRCRRGFGPPAPGTDVFKGFREGR